MLRKTELRLCGKCWTAFERPQFPTKWAFWLFWVRFTPKEFPLSVEFQRLFSFSLIWTVFFHCNGFLSIQSVYLASTGFLCPMSFIQRFSLESAKLVLTAFKGFSKHATNGFFFLALNRFPMPSSYIRRVLLLQCDALAMFLNNFSC